MANHITGTEGANNILGTRGSDHISALGGNDFIHAYPGDDWIFPGSGSDTLFGDEGRDRFIFRPHDSQPNISQDTIRDFHQGEGLHRDIIYLQGFHPGDGHNLHWIHHGRGDLSDPFTGHPGQVRCANGHLQVDVNGDRIPDFDVMIWADNRHPAALTPADVLLF